MAIKFEQVDLELEILPSAQSPSGTSPAVAGSDELRRMLRSPAFRELLRPIVVEIIGDELERTRRRFG